ncbi:MAG: NnrU family protein [Paracoccaceae bacterium]
MIWLVLGILLWALAHFFKRLAPDMRARSGDKAKAGVAVVALIGLALMVGGYRAAPFTNVWYPPAWTIHLTDLLMLFAVGLLALGHSKSRLRGSLRHPMLLGVITWAVAHLLVNGDLASVVLFGGMGLWAVAEIFTINAREPAWQPFRGGSLAGDVRLVVITVVVYAVIAGIHMWLGVPPFPG